MWYDSLLEKNKVPDRLIRMGIRKRLRQRLRDEKKATTECQQAHLMDLLDELKASPIAIHPKDANEQHYELPTAFFQYCLGRHLKYSSGYWKEGVREIDVAEEDMLELTCGRAELTNGQQVLELGCGWGSLSLFMAAKYPQSYFTVVSNSRTQKTFIDGQSAKRKLPNLEVITADMNAFHTEKKFDRVLSVEMFEHMRNYQKLMQMVASCLKQDGKLFVHIFTHKEYTYKFEVTDQSDWMSRYFFTGGIMPGDDLLLYFDEEMNIEKHWHVSGLHYSKTAEAWLRNMDLHKKEIMTIFSKTYGQAASLKWFVYWRIFFMACSELWKFNKGNEWMVSHYLFRKK